MTVLFFLEIGFVILIFLVVFYPEARDALNLYPAKSLEQAVIKYREDPDLQDLINSIQLLVCIQPNRFGLCVSVKKHVELCSQMKYDIFIENTYTIILPIVVSFSNFE